MEAADEEWEANGVKCRARLVEIDARLPASVRRFLNDICLHDAELRGFDAEPAGERVPANAALTLRLGRRVVTLYYDLLEPPERRPADVPLSTEERRAVWVAGETPLWLYDEFDLLGDSARPTGFVHEILLSDGDVLRFVFFAFEWHVHDPAAALAARTAVAV